MQMDLSQAIAEFPVLAWLSNITQIHDTGNVNVYCDCPICGGKKRLGVDRERKLFHCFRCDEAGVATHIWDGKANLLQAIMIFENLHWHDAKKKVYEMTGFPEPVRPKPKKPRQVIPKDAISLTNADDSDPAVRYLDSRGISHLRSTSFLCVSGRYSGRVILPTKYLGEMTGFEAKTYSNQKPKSLYPDWMDVESSVYSTNIDFSAEVLILTESVIDAETFGANALGLYGTIKHGHWGPLLELRHAGIKRLYWALDHDAFFKAAKAIASKALPFFDNYFCTFPMREDPNSLGRKAAWEYARNATHVPDELSLTTLAISQGML